MEGKQTIIQIAKDIYGETVKVYLFGSRLNDEKRGGDIDLLVRSTGEKKGVLARIRMTARLKLHLGDQKIDVIGNHEDSPVVHTNKPNGETESSKPTSRPASANWLPTQLSFSPFRAPR